MQTQAVISRDKLKAKIGTRQMVLVDNITDEHIIARSEGDAPEIDGFVYVQPIPNIKMGDNIEVTITGSDDYDLYAEGK